MLLDDQFFVHDHSQPRSLRPTTAVLRRNVIEQAASMLLQHMASSRPLAENSNGNAFDEQSNTFDPRLKYRKVFQRSDKCHSWLESKPSTNETFMSPVFIDSQLWKERFSPEPPRIHGYREPTSNGFYRRSPRFRPERLMTFSSNAMSTPTHPLPSPSQPIILVHKKRLRREHFLSAMQPPYSPNHFYAFDRLNLIKLQRNLYADDGETDREQTRRNSPHLKRKYPLTDMTAEPDCDCSDPQMNPSRPWKRSMPSPPDGSRPRTADHISLNKYPREHRSPSLTHQAMDPIIGEKELDQDKTASSEPATSQNILFRLEKILNLCGELRSLAKDVEQHVTAVTPSHDQTTEPVENEEVEPAIIDIYQELNMQPVNPESEEKNDLPAYTRTADEDSVHSDSHQSHQLMRTESFKTKSASVSNSHTTLRKPEELCLCFLKSFFGKENIDTEGPSCELNPDEEAYLSELTRAYLLGREQILREQQEQNQLESSTNDVPNFEQEPSLVTDNTNNNNVPTVARTYSSISPSAMLSTDDPGQINVKHQTFLREPIGTKSTHVLPGIGTKYAQQLAECGFPRVRRLLGFYLMIKDDQQFVHWLNTRAKVSSHSSWLCTNALRAWCQEHL